ncbi:MAG: SPOR domain-containing protein, partial [Sphingopyxis sp.]
MKVRRFSPSALLAGLALPAVALSSSPSFAQSIVDRNLSDVSSQTSGSCAVLTVNFNIRVQILSYFPQTSGRELRINVTALDNAARGRESLRPPQGVAALRSIEFESNNGSGAVLSLHFNRDVEFSVAAGERPQTLIISISEPGSGGCRLATPVGSPPVTAPPVTSETGAPAVAAPRPAVAIPRGLYVVNVVSQPGDVTNLNDAQRATLADLVTYETQFERDGQTWHRLRAGFFVSRAQAESARQRLIAAFPEAWVVAVTAQEREQGVVSRLALTPQNMTTTAPIASTIVAAQPLTPEQQLAVTTAEHDAEEALRAGDNDRAIA